MSPVPIAASLRPRPACQPCPLHLPLQGHQANPDPYPFSLHLQEPASVYLPRKPLHSPCRVLLSPHGVCLTPVSSARPLLGVGPQGSRLWAREATGLPPPQPQRPLPFQVWTTSPRSSQNVTFWSCLSVLTRALESSIRGDATASCGAPRGPLPLAKAGQLLKSLPLLPVFRMTS